MVRNNLFRNAVEQSVDNFKRKNKGSMEAIVEQNISDQGSQADRAVPADQIGLSGRDWEANVELEYYTVSHLLRLVVMCA